MPKGFAITRAASFLSTQLPLVRSRQWSTRTPKALCALRTSSARMASQRLRLLSWNIDMDTPPIKLRARALLQQIRLLDPDVILLQEVTAETLPVLTFGLQSKHNKKATIPEAVVDLEGNGSPKPEDGKTFQPEEPVAKKKNPADEAEKSETPSYNFHMGDSWAEDLPYFPVLLTRSGLFKDGSSETTAERFPASRMHRAYICTSGELKASGLRTAFLTSHLESLKESKDMRKAQLFRVFDRQRELVESGAITVFGGDTNLREAEVPASEVVKTVAAEKKRQECGEAPTKRRRVLTKEKFVDAWLTAGADADERFTWDMSVNDNLQFDTEFKPKARYDRVFMLWPKKSDVQVPSMKLVGKDRLPSCGKFVSDHWGLCVDLQLQG